MRSLGNPVIWLPGRSRWTRWNGPRLRAFVDTVLTQEHEAEGLEFEHAVSTISPRRLVIHGRRLNGVGANDRLILLEIDDITEREATER